MVINKYTKYIICWVILSVTLCSLFYNFSHYSLQNTQENCVRTQRPLKYILIWTSNATDPMKNLLVGKHAFLNRKCPLTNCFVSSDRQLLKGVENYDVIIFHGKELKYNKLLLPKSRLPHQKYIFMSMESSAYYPICHPMYNNYFNWTWTYKLNSDNYYGYIVIRDKEGKAIGPKKEMHWMKVEDMNPINDTLKAKLAKKKYAAAWFVSNCRAPSGRNAVAKNLQAELAKFKMTVDIFGLCGKMKCPRGKSAECRRMIETDYYFYLSFENSMSEDYVTEKLLTALNNYAVPVVFGGANYTRFMPDGIYLTITNDTVSAVAEKMVEIIYDKEKYYEYFKWHNHYSYGDGQEAPETDPYCNLCKLINDDDKFFTTSAYNNFGKWWSPPSKCH
nr:alpha-(1,3)-fucosyltransferase C-like isoform X1 [Helicoverpa armigera]